MHPTAGLCWAACRRTPAVADIVDALDAGADVAAAAELAVAQRISPLLWRGMRAAGREDDQAPWGQLLQADAARCRGQARMLFPRLDELVFSPLRRDGLEALVMKGLSLDERYPEPGLRPMDDIDLVMSTRDTTRAVATLRGAGWQLVPEPDTDPAVHLTHPQLPGLPLDLHRGLERERDRTSRLSGEQLWRSRRAAVVHGAAAFTMPTELEIVQLAAHAAKPFHSFGRLIWSVDIAMVVTHADATTAVDWDGVARIAHAARCRTAVAVALTQAERLGATSPAELRRLPDNALRRQRVAAVVSPDWPITPRDGAVRWTLRRSLVDDPRLVARVAFTHVAKAHNAADGVRRASGLVAAVCRRPFRRLAARRAASGKARK